MNLVYTTQFKKDYKRIKKQTKDLAKLEYIIQQLLEGSELDLKYRDHALFGQWKAHRDCHIDPDWILIYRRTNEELILERTDSHSFLNKSTLVYITFCVSPARLPAFQLAEMMVNRPTA